MYINIYIYVIGFFYLIRFIYKIGFIFYVICVVFIVYWIWNIIVNVIYIKIIIFYVKNEEVFEIFDNEYFDVKYYN